VYAPEEKKEKEQDTGRKSKNSEEGGGRTREWGASRERELRGLIIRSLARRSRGEEKKSDNVQPEFKEEKNWKKTKRWKAIPREGVP